MQRPFVIFDLDGVVIDSRRLIMNSYRHAGVTPPRDILSRENDPWVVRQVGANKAAVVRRIKAGHYLNGITAGLAPFTDAYIAAHHLKKDFIVGVMSGAPAGTLRRLRTRTSVWPFTFEFDNTRTIRKMEIIKDLRTVDNVGVYIDDQTIGIDLPPDWSFIHYTGQCTEELILEVRSAFMRRRNIT